MTDNVVSDPGSGGAVFATDDIGGTHYPITKITFGALDSQTLASSGAGNVDAGTQRVVLATDQAAVSVDNGGTFAVQIDGINGTVDANNNSSTPLGIGATFTGTSTDILQFVGITVSVFSDVASAIDGLSVEFSSDGANWDFTDLFNISAGAGQTFSFQPVARFFRVRYTNGGSAQTDFRLSVILKTQIGKSSSHRIADPILDQDDAEIVKAVITGENPSKEFVNFQATTAGNFKVSLEESNGLLTGPGTEATAIRVTMATDSTGLVSIDDNGGSLTVDNGGTFAVQAAQAGTYNITNISGTISLPTGAATAAKQLADGHNVTIDNASGASAVNIQDGGNSITVDNGGTFPVQSTLQAGSATVGNVTIENNNAISTDNSTTSTLTSASTFTGTGEDVSNYAMITVQTDASHDSAADGLTFQFSTDDTNWDDVFPFTYTAANGARRFQLAATAQFFRIVYTNGGTNQTHFRLQTILHVNTGLTTIHRLQDSIDPDRSSTLVKASIIAQAAGSGDFVPVQATASGNLKTSLQEISDGLDIGAGNAESETQRMSISTDDVNLSAIKTAVEGATPTGSNLIGDVGLSVRTSGGTTLYKNIDVDESEDAVKAMEGQIYWIHAMNMTAAPIFLKFYNDTVANVVVGTDVPDLTFPVPANADSDGAGFTLSIPNGIEFSTAITIAATTGVADADTGAPAANALIVNLGFA